MGLFQAIYAITSIALVIVAAGRIIFKYGAKISVAFGLTLYSKQCAQKYAKNAQKRVGSTFASTVGSTKKPIFYIIKIGLILKIVIVI